MARVYPVLARNDLPDNLLQFVDVRPNTSQVSVPVGNTGYITHWIQNSVLAGADIGAGVIQVTENGDGIRAYLIDNVENVSTGKILSPAEIAEIVAVLLARVAAGQSLTLADVNVAINTPATVAGSDLTGVAAGSHSTGTLAGLLAVMSGQVYRVPAGTNVSGAAQAFVAPHAPAGSFLTASDADFRDARPFQWTGSMNLSCLSGQLSKMNSTAFTFVNPSFTYGAGGTAQTIAGVAIPTTGAGRAVIMYLENGTAL
jgi:hypothetical protein